MDYETDTNKGLLCSAPTKETQHKQHTDVNRMNGTSPVQYTNEGDPAHGLRNRYQQTGYCAVHQ